MHYVWIWKLARPPTEGWNSSEEDFLLTRKCFLFEVKRKLTDVLGKLFQCRLLRILPCFMMKRWWPVKIYLLSNTTLNPSEIEQNLTFWRQRANLLRCFPCFSADQDNKSRTRREFWPQAAFWQGCIFCPQTLKLPQKRWSARWKFLYLPQFCAISLFIFEKIGQSLINYV